MYVVEQINIIVANTFVDCMYVLFVEAVRGKRKKNADKRCVTIFCREVLAAVTGGGRGGILEKISQNLLTGWRQLLAKTIWLT